MGIIEKFKLFALKAAFHNMGDLAVFDGFKPIITANFSKPSIVNLFKISEPAGTSIL